MSNYCGNIIELIDNRKQANISNIGYKNSLRHK